MTAEEQAALERFMYPERFEQEQEQDVPATPKADAIDDLVELRLQQAQSKKTYKDIGRKRGTAKEKRALSKVTGGNLADLEEDPETARKMVNKGKVWPELDVQRERDMGSSSGCAYMKVKLHRTLAANPLNSRAAREVYVGLLERWQVEWDDIKTYDGIYEWARGVFSFITYGTWQSEVMDHPWAELNAAMNAMPQGDRARWGSGYQIWVDRLEMIVGKQFSNMCSHASDPARQAWAEAFMFEPFTQEQEQEKRQQYKIDEKRVFELESQIAAIERAETSNDLAMAVGADLWRSQKLALRTIEKKHVWLRSIKSWLENAKKDKLPDKYRARQEDWSWAFTTKEAKETTATGKPKVNTYPFLSRLQRTNALEVSERENSVLTNKWKLKAVQYGNSLTDAESEKLTWHANMAFTDLSDLLGTDISRLHEKGALGLDFATRGHGGAAATYYAGYTVINLTKRWGDGSLAHEWAHFLDNIMAGAHMASKDMVTINGSMGGFASQGRANDPLIQDIVLKIMTFILRGNGTETEMKRIRPINNRFYSHVVGRYSDSVTDDLRYVFNRRPDLRGKKTRQQVLEHMVYLHHLPEGEYEVPLLSSYQFAQSNAIGTDYWVRKPELFARAFEGYVMHLMEQRGMKSDFLQASRKFYTTDHGIYPYPHKTDLDTLVPLFDQLFGAIRIAYGIPAFTAPADAARVSIEVQNTSLDDTGAGRSIDQKQQQTEAKEAEKNQKQNNALLLARARARRVRVLALAA
jgi:hypothetical protein